MIENYFITKNYVHELFSNQCFIEVTLHTLSSLHKNRYCLWYEKKFQTK